MLLKREALDAIESGRVDLAFRRWKRPTVKSGGSLRTPAGLLEIVSVEPVRPEDITEEEALRAGHPDRQSLLHLLESRPDGEVYRIRFGGLRPDPTETLRNDDDLTPGELHDLARRLDRMDASSRRGPWTRAYLRLLAENPHVRAQDLADRVGIDKATFKNDVRKLKRLGLTISHSPGYQLSPRGEALLAHLRATGPS